MISKLQLNSNINFKSVAPAPNLNEQNTLQNNQEPQTLTEENPKKDFSISETYNKAKKSATNVLKNINNVTNVTEGAVRGVVDGIVATTAMGVLGKACKNNNFNVIGILKDTIVDVAKGAWNSIKFIPSVITKSPLENAKTIIRLPKKFYGDYLKGHKSIAALASVIGACVLAIRITQGKINANKKNADLDHKTNQGHV